MRTQGLIIFLNGASSSGKPSIRRELLAILDDLHFRLTADAFHAMRARRNDLTPRPAADHAPAHLAGVPPRGRGEGLGRQQPLHGPCTERGLAARTSLSDHQSDPSFGSARRRGVWHALPHCLKGVGGPPAALSSLADSPTLGFARAGGTPIASTPSSALQLHAPDPARPRQDAQPLFSRPDPDDRP
ncbi:hypothetical protein ACIQ6Y_37185 [Streptomyces sp. NPDC096205]|uniref:phosphotransferase-like protein n=1 Tax=Streptomyces sp. NPDC096205 TaxID=3366081 RepID=UPI0038238A4E